MNIEKTIEEVMAVVDSFKKEWTEYLSVDDEKVIVQGMRVDAAASDIREKLRKVLQCKACPVTLEGYSPSSVAVQIQEPERNKPSMSMHVIVEDYQRALAVWDAEQSQLAAVQQEVQPYAVLVFERGEEGPFDRKPVKPDSVQHLHAKRDPHYDYIELYTNPTQQGMDALKPMGWAAEINGAHFRQFGDWLPDEDCYDNGTLVKLFALPVSEEEAQAERDALDAAQAKQGGV